MISQREVEENEIERVFSYTCRPFDYWGDYWKCINFELGMVDFVYYRIMET